MSGEGSEWRGERVERRGGGELRPSSSSPPPAAFFLAKISAKMSPPALAADGAFFHFLQN